MPRTGEAGRLRPRSGTHTRVFDGELVILDMNGGQYYALDAIGTALWRGLEAGRTMEDIACEIASGYDVGVEEARNDLRGLVEELLKRGLFEVDSGGVR